MLGVVVREVSPAVPVEVCAESKNSDVEDVPMDVGQIPALVASFKPPSGGCGTNHLPEGVADRPDKNKAHDVVEPLVSASSGAVGVVYFVHINPLL